MQQPQQHPLQQPIQQPAPPYPTPAGSSSEPPASGFAHDDALVAPISPGEALARLLRVEPALALLGVGQDELREHLRAATQKLMQAIGAQSAQGTSTSGTYDAAGELQQALHGAQAVLGRCFEAALALENSEEVCRALGFPPPALKMLEVRPVDLSTLTVTFSRPQRQVLTSFAFADAPNATGYRLFELRVTVGGEDYEDSTVASPRPSFSRVRLGAGERRFRIESRNAHSYVLSEYFSINVPLP
jgi:hypothetical protein